jgi:hypothetical protein
MKILTYSNSWFKIVECDSCLATLEIEEADLFCIYRDRHIGKFNIILLNDIVNYYCTCENCESRVSVPNVPKLIQERVAERYPPPVKIKKSWLQKLFDI